MRTTSALLATVSTALSVSALSTGMFSCKRPATSNTIAVSANGPMVGGSQAGTTVAEIGGKPVSLAEVDEAASRDIFEARKRALETLIQERLLEPEAKKEGLTPDQYLKKQVDAKAAKVTEQEAADFFGKNKDVMGPQFKGKKFDEVKDLVIEGMMGPKRYEAQNAILQELKNKEGVKITLRPPTVSIDPTGPSRGADKAKVTLIEFADYPCPSCGWGRQNIDRLLKEYDGKIRVVFRDFFLPSQEQARRPAEAGHCAEAQGKFWEMHDWMLDHPKLLTTEGLKEGATKTGLDVAKFEDCLASGKTASVVSGNVRAGQRAGVRTTPTFFVNGTLVDGPLTFETLRADVDRALKESP